MIINNHPLIDFYRKIWYNIQVHKKITMASLRK